MQQRSNLYRSQATWLLSINQPSDEIFRAMTKCFESCDIQYIATIISESRRNVPSQLCQVFNSVFNVPIDSIG